jgi:hypothetical protein
MTAERRAITRRVAHCRPMATALEPRPAAAEPAPIWFAALVAVTGRPNAEHAVRFEYVSGRAIYTNSSHDTQEIDGLGVSLDRGQTLEVYWEPGETAYTLEVYRQNRRACA